MKLPYCINCSKYLSAFNAHIETHHEIVNGKDMHFNEILASCPTCNSLVWFEAFEEISVQDQIANMRAIIERNGWKEIQ